jgi:hypothetical protein
MPVDNSVSFTWSRIETIFQSPVRPSTVQQWLEDLDQLLGVDWLERKIVKINTLNGLFYSI